MSAADTVAVEMENKKPLAKRRKAKAATAASSSDPVTARKTAKKPAKAGKPEPVEATPRSSVESVRYENEGAERGAFQKCDAVAVCPQSL